MANFVINTLTSIGWLSTLSAPIREVVICDAKRHEFQPGDIVYSSGADGDAIWGIESGSMKMFISAGEERMRFCHVVGPGYWFGELEILLEIPRIIEMKIAEPACLLRLGIKDIHRIAARHSEIWISIARLAATNEALAIAAADDLMLRDPKKRLAATLLRLTGLRWDFQGRPTLNPVPVTTIELSEVANLSRSVTAKILSDFSRDGAVEKGYKTVRVTRPDLLSRIL